MMRPSLPCSRSLASPRGRHASIAGFDQDDFVIRTLAEDLGSGGDVTSQATIPEGLRYSALVVAREPIVVAGIDVAAAFFRRMDADARIETLVEDGER